jgi:hypothetical protein
MANKRAEGRLSATDSSVRPGRFPLGSPQSRAAARSLVNARKESEAEEEWDKELDLTGLAECIAAARQRGEHEAAPRTDWSPIHVPPGKGDTVRGLLAARINAARARMTRFEAEVNPESGDAVGQP